MQTVAEAVEECSHLLAGQFLNIPPEAMRLRAYAPRNDVRGEPFDPSAQLKVCLCVCVCFVLCLCSVYSPGYPEDLVDWNV